MKIVIITQNEPFYLAKNISYLYKLISKDIEIAGVILYEPSPFGKKESLFRKSLKTLNIFGYKFFLFYSIQYILSKFIIDLNVSKTLKKIGLRIIKLNKSINHLDSLEIIRSLKPDLLVSILGSEIFKIDLLNIAPYGCINLHSSLLPKYRGLMPSFWVLKNNEVYSGVSVFFVDEGIDSGPIIEQKKIYLNNLTHRDLIKVSKKVGMDLISKSIYKIKDNQVSLISNPDSKKSYYGFPTKKDVKEFLKLGKRFF